MPLPERLDHFGPLLAGYDVIFSDVWGVVHDGQRAFAACADAFTRFRAGGGTVVLVSNAPMPSDEVARVLDQKGVTRTAWDAIVSSGDLALTHISERGYRRLHRIWRPGFDEAFIARLPGDATAIDQADAIVCTGPLDERREEPEAYRARLVDPARRGVPFVCANPDFVVHVGAALLPCAGAIAKIYEELGGPVYWGGKPHPAAYAEAFRVAARLRGHEIAAARVLAIGDAIRTDLASAKAAGVDAVFITTGIHRDDLMDGDTIRADRLAAALDGFAPPTRAVATAVRW
jgi:HAD superfamily hydrolase (TIGR01459 family)